MDRDDRAWMVPLGCEWPDPAEEQKWLDDMRGLVTVGSQKQSSHPDDFSEVIYKARELFAERLPILKESADKLYLIFSRRRSNHIASLDGLIGTLRLFHDMGQDVRAVLRRPNSTMLRPEAVITRLDNLSQHGLDFVKIFEKQFNVIETNPWVTTEKLQVIYSFVRACGIEDYRSKANRVIEARPQVLHNSAHKLRVLGRISMDWFKGQPPNVSMAGLVIPNLERVIAVYLGKDKTIRRPGELREKTRELEGYSPEQLRSYIIQYADDPVVKAYLRGYPIGEEIVQRKLHRLRWRDQEKSITPYGPDGLRIAKRAASFQQFEQSLRRMPEEDLDDETPDMQRQKAFWFNSIATGLEAEAALTSENFAEDELELLQEDRDAGRNMRQRVVMAYAVRAINQLDHRRYNRETGWYGEDRIQTQLLKLMMATIDFARRDEATRASLNFWEYVKRRLRTMHIEFSDLED